MRCRFARSRSLQSVRNECMKIKAVLFDADGVVVFPWRFARYLEREHGVTADMTREFFRRAFERCLVGETDLKEVLPPFLAEWGWEGTVEEFVAMWLETENAVDDRVAGAICSLRESGLSCCLATSQEKYRAAYMREAMGFGELFDRLFFSCELGYLKPDEAFYRSVEKSLGLAAGSILFWDDSVQNVAGARECGWHAEVYVGFEDFEQKLGRYLPQMSAGARLAASRP